ncbi:MAG TPA: phosphate ABC transporter substrate-binding protein PstS [Polyangia bacterium]|jgi:phosphate transport system substrate-binding protein|nr:phosphate ABC transporter substrate-binding protein PstS [Polyangia bacterium]
MIKTSLFAGALAVLGLGAPGIALGAAVTLNGSGSTLSKPYQEVAIDQFRKTHKDMKINYGGGGSGKGRQDLADAVVDFAGSDSPFKAADLAKAKGGAILYFPILLSPISVIYNVAGVDKLQLSAPVIAKIFQREITKWSDKAIAAENPGAKLPDTAIVVAHRADGSGTTQNFTEYLNGAAKGVWKLKSGSTVEWPSDTQAGQGSAGVAQIVKSTQGAIGYVDLSDAKASAVKYATIKNKAGKYVEATPAGASAAGDGIEVKDNLLFSALDAKGDKAYPITAQTWVIVYAKQSDKAKGDALKSYLMFLVKDGQGLLTDIDYAPLPKGLQDKAIKQVDKLMLP